MYELQMRIQWSSKRRD